MNAYCKITPSVTDLLARHQAAWNEFNAAWTLAPELGAPQHSVDRLTDIHGELFEAKPVSMSEWFAKWKQIERFEHALGDDDNVPEIIRVMLSEIERLNGRWCEP